MVDIILPQSDREKTLEVLAALQAETRARLGLPARPVQIVEAESKEAVSVDIEVAKKIIDDTWNKEIQEAQEAKADTYIARAFAYAGMPHSETNDIVFTRKNGNFTLGMYSMEGLPYGPKPRLIMTFITTEAAQTKSNKIFLGNSLNEYMTALNLGRSGGERGPINYLKKQMKRLLACAITVKYDDGEEYRLKNITPVEEAEILFWKPRNPDQRSLWQSSITLTDKFFKEVIDSPIPIRLETLRAIQRSSMAMDFYFWLTHKNFYSKKPCFIPWIALLNQFGAGYSMSDQGLRNFKKEFISALKKVAAVYPAASLLKYDSKNLIYIPGAPDVPPLIQIK